MKELLAVVLPWHIVTSIYSVSTYPWHVSTCTKTFQPMNKCNPTENHKWRRKFKPVNKQKSKMPHTQKKKPNRGKINSRQKIEIQKWIFSVELNNSMWGQKFCEKNTLLNCKRTKTRIKFQVQLRCLNWLCNISIVYIRIDVLEIWLMCFVFMRRFQ